jgi:hypothetical protein
MLDFDAHSVPITRGDARHRHLHTSGPLCGRAPETNLTPIQTPAYQRGPCGRTTCLHGPGGGMHAQEGVPVVLRGVDTPQIPGLAGDVRHSSHGGRASTGCAAAWMATRALLHATPNW